MSMLTSHVLLCEHPEFKTTIPGSLLRQLKQAIFIFLLFIFLIFVRDVVGGFFCMFSTTGPSD